MLDARHIDYAERVARVARDGSPGILHAVGRLYGLGQPERDALARNGVPSWVWGVLGVGLGVVVGARIQNRWPGKVPRMISGGRA